MDALPEKKRRLPAYDIGHVIFLIIILILVIAAAGAIVYSSKRYVSLGQEYNEKVRELEEKNDKVTELEQELAQKQEEISELKAEQAAGASDILIRQKNKEIEDLRKELSATQKELGNLKDYSRCDELLAEFKEEYNDAADRLFEKTKNVCAELYFGGTTYDDPRQLKNMIDAEVKVDEYKAGFQPPAVD